MPDTPDDLEPVRLLVASRLLVGGEKGAKRDQVRKDLEPLLSQRWSGSALEERLDAALDGLTAAGWAERSESGRGKRAAVAYRLADAGRAGTLRALGLDALPPKTTWKQLLAKALAARALGLPAPTGAAARTFGSPGGFQAAVLRARNRLPIGEFATAAKASDALLWKLLGRETDRKFDLGSVRQFLLSRALGEPAPARVAEALRRLVARELKPRNSSQPELRAAAVRLWLEESSGGAETPPERPPLPLDEFARRVVEAARSSPSGRFGDDKVFIAHAWRLVRDDPAFRGLGLDGFKRRLVEANHARHLDLGRADLVQVMDPDAVRESEARYFNSTFHFIVL